MTTKQTRHKIPRTVAEREQAQISYKNGFYDAIGVWKRGFQGPEWTEKTGRASKEVALEKHYNRPYGLGALAALKLCDENRNLADDDGSSWIVAPWLDACWDRDGYCRRVFCWH